MWCKFQINGNFGEREIVSYPPIDSRLKGISKGHKILPMIYRGLFLAGILIFSFTGFHSVVHAAIYYLSPSGSDTKAGTSTAPWKTFSFAIPKLQPGDTLILKDGTYTGSNSGYPNINGSTNANNGTATNFITVKAENERKAFIEGTGLVDTVRIANLSYWIFEGIYAKGAENHSATDPHGNVFRVISSSNLVFKRLLLTHNNRWLNTHLLAIENCNNMLVEESEFYYFHRHAVLNWNTNNSVYRRLYGNSRGHANVTGGYKSTFPTRGETLVSIYPGSNNIVENAISEGNTNVVDIQATLTASNNRFLGLISLGDHYGSYLAARGSGSKMPVDTYYENFVSINPTSYGIFARGTKNTQVKNASLFGGMRGLVADYESILPGDGVYSIFSENVLSINNTQYGSVMVNQATYGHSYMNGYNNGTNFSPSSGYTNTSTVAPELGPCKVFIPQNSPLKGKGEGGADIGANILYRYEKGVLTNQPLWNTTTGEFPHGARVAGVNDIPGSSAFDVHKRLNVNFNGCPLPENYGERGESDLTPKNLTIVTSG
jgi:hypothetical protein